MPVARALASSSATSPIGRAAVLTGRACVIPTGCAASSRVPQALHSPHRPTHLTVVQPHSAQRYAGARVDRPVALLRPDAAALVAMPRTVGDATDRRAGPRRTPGR